MQVFQNATAGQPASGGPVMGSGIDDVMAAYPPVADPMAAGDGTDSAASAYPLAIQGLLDDGVYAQPYSDALRQLSLDPAGPQSPVLSNDAPLDMPQGDLPKSPAAAADVSSRYRDLAGLTLANKAATLDPSAPIVEPTVNINGLNYVGNGGNVTSIARELDSVPDYIDSFVSPAGLTVHATLNDIGQDPDFGNTPTANDIPRGWDNVTSVLPGTTLKSQVRYGSLPGVYFPDGNEVILATSPVVGESSYDVDVHEFGHGVDAVLGKIAGAPGGLISNAPGFQAAVNADAAAQSKWPSPAYYSPSRNHDGYLSESFAESFANYYGNTTGASDDEAGNPNFGDAGPENAPSLYNFMNKLDAAIEAARASKTPNATLKQLLAPILYPLPKK